MEDWKTSDVLAVALLINKNKMKKELQELIIFASGILIILGCIASIFEPNSKNGYVDQHTMWYDGQEYLYTFIYYNNDIHSFEKDSIHLVNDSIKELRIKTAEETLKTLR